MNKSLMAKAKLLAQQPYTIDILEDETVDGRHVYLIACPQLPGCMAQGSTIEEAEENLREVTVEYILSLLEDGEPVPFPFSRPTTTTSGAINTGIRDFVQKQGEQNFLDDLSKTVIPSTRRRVAIVEWIS
jgi:predicted RNase H-like HicB family nuclease